MKTGNQIYREFKAKVGMYNFVHLLDMGIEDAHYLSAWSITQIEYVLELVDLNPLLHIITFKNGKLYNKYIPDGTMFYIGDGDPAPELSAYEIFESEEKMLEELRSSETFAILQEECRNDELLPIEDLVPKKIFH